MLALIIVFGLMWFGSHTYRDNEVTFRRIFGYPRPASITVHRSEVWEGRHFFFLLAESSWHIELDAPKDFIARLTTSDTGIFSARALSSGERDYTFPAWFAPKAPDAYERWDASEQSSTFPNGSLFIDRESGRVFVYYNSF
jgi:hypothetical protein